MSRNAQWIAIASLSAAILLLAHATASAQATPISTVHRGWVQNNNGAISHSPSNQNYICGFSGAGEYRNFFIFDLPAHRISGARLRLDNPNPQGVPDFTVYRVDEPAATFFNPVTSMAVWDDLGTGDVFGEMPSASYSHNPVEFDLNATAITYLDTNRGTRIVIGGRNTVPGTSIFGFTSGTHTVQLLLDSNHAPDLTPGTTLLPDMDEDPVTVPTTQVLTLIAGHATDVDNDPLGIAVTQASGGGTWQYSLDNGVTWEPMGGVSAANSRLLDDAALIRFTPNPNWYGPASITYRAWDHFVGSPGDMHSTSNNGGATAFSADTREASLEVHPINDPPVHSFPASVTVLQNRAFAFTGTNAVSVSDVDIYGGELEMTLSTSNGTLSIPESATVTYLTGSNGSSSFKIRAPILQINSALQGLRFTPTEGFVGGTTITLLSDDLGQSGAGGPMTANDTITVSVQAAPDLQIRHGGHVIPHEATYSPDAIIDSVMMLRIYNNGDETLTLSGTEPVQVLAEDNCETALLQPVNMMIGPGEWALTRVRILPLTAGDISFQLSVSSNDPTRDPYVVTVEANTSVFRSSPSTGCAGGLSANGTFATPVWVLLLVLAALAVRRRQAVNG